jgi:hypothetical protein
MTRPLHPDTAAATDKSVIPLAFIIRLDILDDPLFAWSGIGDLKFAVGETGDPALDGQTFTGTGTIIEVGTVSDSVGGSDALEIGLPGVNIQDPILRQVIYNRNRWQFRRAWVWAMLLDEDTGAIAGKPFRIKTGRMDAMPYSENDKGGTVKCKIEGQQAYGDQPLDTRYSEQKNVIDPNDYSQSWVLWLANATAAIGQPTAVPAQAQTSGGGSYGVYGGSGGGYGRSQNEALR